MQNRDHDSSSVEKGVQLFLRVLSSILISIFLVSSQSYASQAEKAYKSAKQAYSKLKKTRSMETGNEWRKVINLYEGFINKYPKDSRGDDALLTLGELYTGIYGSSGNGEDINAAIEAYNTLVRKRPKSRLADDAVFRTGEIYLNHKKNREAAYVEFDKVLRRYPKGDMAAKAAAMVKELSKEAKTEEPKNRPVESPEPDRKNTTVSGIKYWSNPEYTRVVVYADRKASFKETFLKERDGDHPPRLFLDIAGAKLSPEIQPVSINDGLLKTARAGQFSRETVRVVLDIESIDSYKIFALEDPFRIVVDVSGEKEEKRIEDIISRNEDTEDASPSTLAEPEEVKPQAEPSVTSNAGYGIRRIVVDPGHGGKDSGAIGYKGLKEKDVVLDVGKILRDMLTERLGVEVVMTRETDIFIPLEERTAIANTAGADLFISIHANASRNKDASGIETYFLNFATDEDSMRLAAMENATTAKNVSDLQAILQDLMLNSKINESSKLARYVQGSILDVVNGGSNRARDRGVKQAPFYVLIGAQMPSILIETSFITNKSDAKRLANEVFQKTIARAIVAGIERYSEVVKVASNK